MGQVFEATDPSSECQQLLRAGISTKEERTEDLEKAQFTEILLRALSHDPILRNSQAQRVDEEIADIRRSQEELLSKAGEEDRRLEEKVNRLEKEARRLKEEARCCEEEARHLRRPGSSQAPRRSEAPQGSSRGGSSSSS